MGITATLAQRPTPYRGFGYDLSASGIRSGRYHLYVSYACPWAHRTLIARVLAGLTSAVTVTVVDPVMDDDGWHIAPGRDPIFGEQRPIRSRIDDDGLDLLTEKTTLLIQVVRPASKSCP